MANFYIITDPEINASLIQDFYRFSVFCQSWLQSLMLAVGVLPAADQLESWAVGQPLITPCNP
eukprot:1140394-Pelagomonas_calceolata.AAC.6